MAKNDEKTETKFTETFHFKFLLVAIVVTILVTVVVAGLYYFTSPYQNCVRDTSFSARSCINRTDW